MTQKAAGRRGPQMRQQIVERKGGDGAPGGKSRGKPSSEHISGRRKSWLSLREKTDGRGNDAGERSGQPWWKSPMMKAERLRRAASVDTLPKGQDAKQGLAGTEGSAVGEAETPEPNAAIANGSNDNGRG